MLFSKYEMQKKNPQKTPSDIQCIHTHPLLSVYNLILPRHPLTFKKDKNMDEIWTELYTKMLVGTSRIFKLHQPTSSSAQEGVTAGIPMTSFRGNASPCWQEGLTLSTWIQSDYGLTVEYPPIESNHKVKYDLLLK
ncbi:hypothetical protein ATANTOWER_020742 [Ataeniobius toweri]|uniref:Uncharacterized protein n=1 Tax=Ataeniobius toweri TaxID=208326 RepID=A0ABU7AGQ2_9TELE|nr:hypothetical protein [Ataeniobius toweri]